MNLKNAASLAQQHIAEQFAANAPRDLRLETFLYDDHMMVWSLTVGFVGAGDDTRTFKMVRVSEANGTVLSVQDT